MIHVVILTVGVFGQAKLLNFTDMSKEEGVAAVKNISSGNSYSHSVLGQAHHRGPDVLFSQLERENIHTYTYIYYHKVDHS